MDSLGQSIAAQLRMRIVRGDLEAGARVSENPVAREFETSRAPVREAFRLLEGEGLIELKRMGAVVLGVDDTDIRELYEVRCLIESFACRRLLRHESLKEVTRELCMIADNMEVALRYGKAKEFADLDFAFHDRIFQAIGHRRIRNLWNQMRHLVDAVICVTTLRRFEEQSEALPDLIGGHRVIAETLDKGDPEALDDLLNAHFKDAHRSIRELLLEDKMS